MSRHTSLIGLLLLALLVAACNPAPTTTPLPTETPTATPRPQPEATATVGVVPQTAGEPTTRGQLRLVQAAPQSGAVDVYLEQGLIAGRLAPGAFTNPVQVEAGEYLLRVVPVGALPNSQVLAETSVSIRPEGSVLAVLTGTAETLTLALFEEDLSPLPADQSRLAVIHAVPRGPAFSLQLDGQSFDDALDFGQISAIHLVEAATHRLTLSSGDVLLAETEAVLAPQRAYTAILVGQAGGGNYRLLLFNTPVTTLGHVRFIHAGPDLPDVDVLLEDGALAANLGYRQASAWTAQPTRTYRLRVVQSGADAEASPLAQTTLNLSANQALEILLLAERGAPALRIFTTSLDATPPNRARLVVVNAIPDTPIVQAFALDAPLAEIPMIAYGTATRALHFPAGAIEMYWLRGQGDDADAVEFTGEVEFLAGYAYTYVLTGAERDPFVLADEVGVNEAASVPIAASEAGGPEPVQGAAVDSGTDRVQVRVVNALSESLDVRARLDDLPLTDSLPAGEASDYSTLPAGTYTLRIEPGEGSPNAPAYYVSDIFFLETERLVSLVIYGQADAMRVRSIPDYENPVSSGQAILRVLNAAPDQGQLFVTVEIPGIGPTPAPAETPLPEEAEGEGEGPAPLPTAITSDTYQSSAIGPGDGTEFIGLPRGEYNIQVHSIERNEVVAIVPHLALEGGTRYDLLLLPGDAEDILAVRLVVTESDS